MTPFGQEACALATLDVVAEPGGSAGPTAFDDGAAEDRPEEKLSELKQVNVEGPFAKHPPAALVAAASLEVSTICPSTSVAPLLAMDTDSGTQLPGGTVTLSKLDAAMVTARECRGVLVVPWTGAANRDCPGV